MDSKLHLLMVLVPGLPLSAAILTALFGPRHLKAASHWPVILALAGSFLASLGLLTEVKQRAAETADKGGYEHVLALWTWMDLPDALRLDAATASLSAGAVANATNTGADASAKTAPGSALRDFRIDVTLRADPLTSTMLSMVTFISTLVAIFAAGYMKGERGYWRFFTYIALFVFSMTMLVSVSNFALLFVFWEAVGVCSYLLIGFWYPKPDAAAAGMKAFLVNRVGDFGFALALFLIWTTYGTLDFHDRAAVATFAGEAAATAEESTGDSSSDRVAGPLGVVSPSRIKANAYWGGGVGLTICLLLMLGACGKSAQFPLHVWLPDAMEGPTPVSALIHAATMVTAGVYMVTRCTPLFSASPEAQATVAVVGGATALLAGLIALTQHDLKRVLAYSTVSQLGYMFLGLGTGSLLGIVAGMFHLFTHAFFKALLFLGSGSVMHAMGHIIDMRRFSGLRRLMPVTHATFLIGCLALAGVPPLSGFWSKDAIVASLHEQAHHWQEAGAGGSAHAAGVAGVEGKADGSHAANAAIPAANVPTLISAAALATLYQGLYFLALLVAFMTAFYTFRAFYLTFYGPERIPAEAGSHAHESPWSMCGPLAILAVLAAGIGGYLEWTHGFAHFVSLAPSLAGGPVLGTEKPGEFHLTVAATSTLVALGGILLASYLYLGSKREVQWLSSKANLEELSSWMDVERVAKWRQKPWIAAIHAGAKGIGLGWLTAILGNLALFAALLLTAPLALGHYVSPYRLSYRKFYWDEIYMATVVWPLQTLGLLLAWIDRWIVDGAVNLCGRMPTQLGSLMRSLQMGLVPFYGLAMLLGTLILIAAKLLWAGS
jgi:NADH-quinone oxidoreductase subunit L